MATWSRDSLTQWWTRNHVFCLLGLGLLIATIVLWEAQRRDTASVTEKVQTMVQRMHAAADQQDAESPAWRILFEELDSFEKPSFRHEAFRHLALASLVALVLLLFVEIHTSNKIMAEGEAYRKRLKEEVDAYKHEISTNVWAAIARKQIPDEIVLELNRVLKADGVFRSPRYTITLGRPYEGLPNGLIVVRRELSFSLWNLTGQEGFPYPLRTTIDNPYADQQFLDKDGHPVTIPRIAEYVVEDAGKKTEFDLSNVRRQFAEILRLPNGRPVFVYSMLEELKRIQDRVVYTLVVPAIDFRVTVKEEVDEDLDIIVLFNHPNRGAFRKTREGPYEYLGGILPGQSFSVEWRLR